VAVCRLLELETNDVQDQIVGDPRRHVIFRAARRVGKSYTGAKRHFPLSLMPKSLHWIVAPTYDLAHKEFRYWLEFLLAFQAHVNKKCIVRVEEQPGAGNLLIRTTWGATVIGKSAANPQSLLGEALDSVLYGEAAQLTRDVWTAMYVRP
jgi:hypothetical protein